MLQKLTLYPTPPGSVNAEPVRGQFLSRKRHWLPHEREFWAADLYRGQMALIEPTLAQATFLTGAGSITGVWWALQRESFREDVMRGQLPLVPKARPSVPEVISADCSLPSDPTTERQLMQRIATDTAFANRVLAALDHITGPALVPAE